MSLDTACRSTWHSIVDSVTCMLQVEGGAGTKGKVSAFMCKQLRVLSKNCISVSNLTFPNFLTQKFALPHLLSLCPSWSIVKASCLNDNREGDKWEVIGAAASLLDVSAAPLAI